MPTIPEALATAGVDTATPTLLLFLRHLGCTFCREALAELAARRAEIEGKGVRVVGVVMGPAEFAAEIFGRYGLADVPRVVDPSRELYRAFGLGRAGAGQMFRFRFLKRWLESLKHGQGLVHGDGLQLGGAFLVHQGRVIRGHANKDITDHADLRAVAVG